MLLSLSERKKREWAKENAFRSLCVKASGGSSVCLSRPPTPSLPPPPKKEGSVEEEPEKHTQGPHPTTVPSDQRGGENTEKGSQDEQQGGVEENMEAENGNEDDHGRGHGNEEEDDEMSENTEREDDDLPLKLWAFKAPSEPSKEKDGPLLLPSITSLPPKKYDPENPTQLFDLPPGLRYKIYQMIPTSERIWTQLVCRKMRDEIRVRIGIAAFVDEDTTWGPSFMRDIVYDTIVVGQYRQPKLRTRQIILRWYDVLHLHFIGPISMPYVDAFFARCRGVRKVTINCELSERQPVPIDLWLRRDYKACRKLDTIKRCPIELWQCKMLEICPTGPLGFLTVKHGLEVGNYVKIVTLKIVVNATHTIKEARVMHEALLKFIETHPHVKNVWMDSKVAKFEPKKNKIDFLLPEREVRAASKAAQLSNLILIGAENLDFVMWACFLLDQHRMEVLQVIHCFLYPVMLLTVKANKYTLRKIAFHVILEFSTKQKNKFLDLNLFSECAVLKELYICISNPERPKEKYALFDNVTTTHVSNFKFLPKSLEVLALRNATFSNKDASNVSLLPNLKSLGLTLGNPLGSKSRTFSVKLLLTLVKIRSLNELLVQGNTTSLQREVVDRMSSIGTSTGSSIPGTKYVLYIWNKVNDDMNNRWEQRGTRKKLKFKIIEENTNYEV